MIDEIVADILVEANRRPGKDMISCIFSVAGDVEKEIIRIIENLRIEERRKEEDERQGEYLKGVRKEQTARSLRRDPE